MIRVKGRYRDKTVELDQPLNLQDGTEVEVHIGLSGEQEDEDWAALGMERFEEGWDNPKDAVYDDWRRLYGV